MADKTIAQLAALPAGTLASTDVFPVVDVSDTTQSPQGTTKKIEAGALFTSPNITGPFITGVLKFLDAVSRIIPGATSFAIRNPGNTVDHLRIDSATGTIVTRGHQQVSGDPPTLILFPDAGIGATAGIAGTDTAGVITLTTGSGALSSGTVLKVQFAAAYPAPPAVFLEAAGAMLAADLVVQPSGVTETYVELTSLSGLTPSTAYRISYCVIGVDP